MRQTDQAQKTYFRSAERVFHMNGAWFFAAREGDQGPYPSPDEAEREVDRYITEKTELAHFQSERERERDLGRADKLALEPLELAIEPLAEVLPRRSVYS